MLNVLWKWHFSVLGVVLGLEWQDSVPGERAGGKLEEQQSRLLCLTDHTLRESSHAREFRCGKTTSVSTQFS